MDLTGLLDKIHDAATAIDYGRKGFAVRGKAEEGRISYETGISLALSTFRDAQSTADPHTIILIEYTFLSQELQFCVETDTHSRSSLTQAIQSFDWKAGEPRHYNRFPYQRQTMCNMVCPDAFLAIETVEDSTLYQGAERTHPHSQKYRVSGFPKDSFHIAALAHRTRLQNILRSPGIDPIEKTLLKQRFDNLATGQKGYIELQRKALSSKNKESNK